MQQHRNSGRAAWGAVGVIGLLAAGLLAGTAGRVGAAPLVLYDGTIAGQTPADQRFFYLTEPWPAAAQVSYSNGGTTLDTTPAMSDLAGYFLRPGVAPTLDRSQGFTLRFTTQVLEETHVSTDRAGLSLILVAADLRAIELGFWTDSVWAQNDGDALFTRGESAALDLAAAPVAFTLTVLGERYTLDANGVRVLEGPLRDYSSWGPPYSAPNVLFLGDNTSRAAAVARLLFVSVEAEAPTSSSTATPSPSSTVTATVSPTATPSPSPTTISAAPVFSQRVHLPLIRR